MAKRRKPGDGSVRLRKDGRWEARFVVGYKDNGYPQTKNVLAKTKAECLAKLEKLKEEMGASRPEKDCPEMSFGDWLNYWYENCSKPRIRGTTQQGTEDKMRLYIIPQLGSIPLNKLTKQDLQQFYSWLRDDGRTRCRDSFGNGLSNSVVRGCHGTCRKALQRAMDDGLIRINPAVGCKLPPKKAKEMQVLTKDEMQRFLIQANEEGYFELFLLELCTGMRRGEILALQWQDLNWKTGELKIKRQVGRVKGKLLVSVPKTKASVRTVILPPEVVGVLREYRMRTDSRWMFPSPVKADSPLDPKAVYRRLQAILEHAQCKRVRFHDLRHTFATTALEHGMDIKTLSAIIGHVSAATSLNIYTHVTDKMQRRAAAKIDKGIGGNATAEDDLEAEREAPKAPFQPYKGEKRRPGQGCITQINDHLWEGRYSPVWPDGKKHSRNVYAHTREECEAMLPGLIKQMRAEIEAIKDGTANIPDTGSKKRRLIAEYMYRHPEDVSKSSIARAVGVHRTTVSHYYDEIRREMKRKSS